MDSQTAVRAYHQRSKHQLQRYAAGPDTLDWDAQPNPFRQWAGAPQLRLPLAADALTARWADLAAGVPSQVFSWTAVAALLELSFGLTAWKQFGPDRWALRANPSSGNLHPVEAYVLSAGVPGLPDGVHHYEPLEHLLAQRQVWPALAPDMPSRLWIGLSLIQWREAWKYGERAFRYCELDTGHALGALRYAAASLGWQARVVTGQGDASLSALLGLDRIDDFGVAEREVPALLIELGPHLAPGSGRVPALVPQDGWAGQANRLDARPMYRWPVINDVTTASVTPPLPDADEVRAHPPSESGLPNATQAIRADQLLATLIRGRRSAQHFDRRGTMPLAAFFRMLSALMPDHGLPWDSWAAPARVHPVLFAHRVEGLAPGAYVLPRSEAGAHMLQQSLVQGGLQWERVPEAPANLPLVRLVSHPALAGTLRTLSCHQAIASDACFAVSFLAEFGASLADGAWHYRQLFREAGLLGQVLYMQAEADGFRGTGIGCYFDDAVHELLGLKGEGWQVMYHFTVGVPMSDERISTEPPYAGRASVNEPV